MKMPLERVLVVQSQKELRAYTCSLLTDLGFRHVLQAESMLQAEQILASISASKKSIQLVVCDDTLPEGALAIHQKIAPVPCTVISDAQNPRNVRIAARLGISSLLFRPYGKAQLLKAIVALVN